MYLQTKMFLKYHDKIFYDTLLHNNNIISLLVLLKIKICIWNFSKQLPKNSNAQRESPSPPPLLLPLLHRSWFDRVNPLLDVLAYERRITTRTARALFAQQHKSLTAYTYIPSDEKEVNPLLTHTHTETYNIRHIECINWWNLTKQHIYELMES